MDASQSAALKSVALAVMVLHAVLPTAVLLTNGKPFFGDMYISGCAGRRGDPLVEQEEKEGFWEW